MIAVAAAGLSLLASCGQGAGPVAHSPRQSSTQTLRFPVGTDFGTLDPAYLDTQTDAEIAQNLFDGLVDQANDLRVVPGVASMPSISPDGLTYTFRLRRDVTFWNGDRVTAKDVLYSWDRAAALQGPYSTNLAAIAGFDRIPQKAPPGAQVERLLQKNDRSVTLSGLTAPDGADGYTVRVRLSRPAGWFLSAVSQPGVVGMIVDQKVVARDPVGWWKKPTTLVGTGAYRMIARSPGQSADFAATSGWWGGPKPAAARVHVGMLPDARDREAAYEEGEYDINGYGGFSNLALQDILRIRRTQSLRKQLLLRPGGRSYWLSFNLTTDSHRKAAGPFVDSSGSAAKALRQAFDLAIDKKKLVDAVCRDVLCGPATGGIVAQGMKGYLGDKADPLAGFDPARARQLLKGADPGGSKTKGLVYAYDAEDPVNQPTARNLQEQWRTNLGVDVEIRPEPHDRFVVDRLGGSLVLSRDGWTADFDHPSDWFDNKFGSLAGCPDANCSSGYTSSQFDRLALEADAQPLDKALPMYQQMSKMLIDEVAYLPLYHTTDAFMIQPYVRGAGANDLLDYRWDGIRLLPH
jgi:ABC-type oligopeptide transport system substrate-binding subunit